MVITDKEAAQFCGKLLEGLGYCCIMHPSHCCSTLVLSVGRCPDASACANDMVQMARASGGYDGFIGLVRQHQVLSQFPPEHRPFLRTLYFTIEPAILPNDPCLNFLRTEPSITNQYVASFLVNITRSRATDTQIRDYLEFGNDAMRTLLDDGALKQILVTTPPRLIALHAGMGLRPSHCR